MLDAAAPRRLVARPAPALPVDRLVRGKPAAEAAALVPRLFNLCRAAQDAALRAALGLPDAGGAAALAAEIRRDHVLRFALVLPRHFGQPVVPLAENWRTDAAGLARALFGGAGRLPESPAAFAQFLASDAPVAATLRRVAEMFPPGTATADGLLPVDARTAFDPRAAVENSTAQRVAAHPVMADLARRIGHGPLWRVAGRAYDLERMLTGPAPAVASHGPGAATVPATRGLYAVRARVADGIVAAFTRVTPTDHLLAPGGMLDRTLASLPADRVGAAALLLDILDPCTPLGLTETADA